MHKAFFARLLDSHDPSADSLIFLSFVGAIALTIYSGYDLIVLKHNFGALDFGAGYASIATGLGAGKALRSFSQRPEGRRPACHGRIDDPDAE